MHAVGELHCLPDFPESIPIPFALIREILKFSRYFPDIFPLFSRYVPDIFPIFSRYVPDIFPIFSRCFPIHVYFPGSIPLPCVLIRKIIKFSRYFPLIFPILSRYFPVIFPLFSRYFPDIFLIFSRYFPDVHHSTAIFPSWGK